MHRVELLTKCRKLTYDKITGEVVNVSSGGGAIEQLTGDDYIMAKYSPNDGSDPTLTLCCIEKFYSRRQRGKPISVDLTTVTKCTDAVTASISADADLDAFVYETGLLLVGELLTVDKLTEQLRRTEVLTRRVVEDMDAQEAHHATIERLQAELQAKQEDCISCCEALLTTRDEVITFAPSETDEEMARQAELLRESQ